MGLYALSAWLNPLAGLSRLPSIGKVTMTGSKVTMELPRLAGFTRDGRSYELTASAAAQDLSQPQLIELKDLRAKVELQDKNVVNVTAQAGIYDTKSEAVSLSQNIVVASPGYEVRLSEALLDMKKGTVVSQKPVEVLLPGGRLNANQLEVQESGDVVVFRGGVTMHLEAQRTSAEPGPQERGP
jgi:lipopolysaccharide export system protein LptC